MQYLKKLDGQTLDMVINEIQKFIDKNYSCDNADHRIGYQLALYKMYKY